MNANLLIPFGDFPSYRFQLSLVLFATANLKEGQQPSRPLPTSNIFHPYTRNTLSSFMSYTLPDNLQQQFDSD